MNDILDEIAEQKAWFTDFHGTPPTSISLLPKQRLELERRFTDSCVSVNVRGATEKVCGLSIVNWRDADLELTWGYLTPSQVKE